ncbi:hypothetical protein D3C81_1155680 [compost metagenome]
MEGDVVGVIGRDLHHFEGVIDFFVFVAFDDQVLVQVALVARCAGQADLEAVEVFG